MKIYLVNIDNKVIAIAEHPLELKNGGWRHDIFSLKTDNFINAYKNSRYGRKIEECLDYLFETLPLNQQIEWDI